MDAFPVGFVGATFSLLPSLEDEEVDEDEDDDDEEDDVDFEDAEWDLGLTSGIGEGGGGGGAAASFFFVAGFFRWTGFEVASSDSLSSLAALDPFEGAPGGLRARFLLPDVVLGVLVLAGDREAVATTLRRVDDSLEELDTEDMILKVGFRLW